MGHEKNGHVPYELQDNAEVLEFFADLVAKDMPTAAFVETVAKNTEFWGEDLSAYDGFVASVSTYLDDILTNGAMKAMEAVL